MNLITDGLNCVISQGKFYHTNLNCENLKWEIDQGFPTKQITIKEAKSQKMTYCMNCSRDNYLFKHGREDEIR